MRKGKPWFLAALALAGMSMSGCAALGIGNGCGTCGFQLPRLFHHKAAAADCCAPGELPATEIGVPGAVVTTPGAVMAAPAAPAEIEQLSPAAPAGNGSSRNESGSGTRSGSSTSGSGAAAVKSNYNTYRSYRAGPSRGENLARALAPSEPARRPAQRRASPSRSASPAASASNPLDNLPPLTLPVDPTSSDLGSPPTALDPGALPRAAEEIKTGSPPAAGARADAAGGKTVGSNSPTAAGPAASVLAPEVITTSGEADPSITVTPGIKRFQGLEPKLAGGSLPSQTGLDWLADKGYKTILDLREPGAAQAAYITEASTRGLRYIALPISSTTLDADHVARFNAELDQADARPLYFFDTEGDRAGALWYIRRLTVDKVKADAKTASQEARDLGLSDETFMAAASAYLSHVANIKPAQDPAAHAASATVPGPASAPSPAAPTPVKSTEPAALNTTPAAATQAQAQAETAAAAAVVPRDPTAWRPFAALLVTGLGIPLAYFGRMSLVSLGAYVRASLPGPGPSRKSLPPASGA